MAKHKKDNTTWKKKCKTFIVSFMAFSATFIMIINLVDLLSPTTTNTEVLISLNVVLGSIFASLGLALSVIIHAEHKFKKQIK